MPADALWAFAMACNVYLTFFHKYDSERLRRLVWKYVVCCYGLPFILALTYFFIETKDCGKVYGSAVVSEEHVSLFQKIGIPFLSFSNSISSSGAGLHRSGTFCASRCSTVRSGSL